jgi:hypothetical protein
MLRPIITNKPGLERSPLLAGGLVQDAFVDFSHGKGSDKKILVGLIGHPRHQSGRWLRLRDAAQDIGIEKVAH